MTISRKAPADVLGLRRHNLSLVLHYLRDHEQSARIQVAADTGLAAGAVTSLVTELIEFGLVEEVGLRESGSAGRPRRLLTLGGASVAAVGAQLDAETIAVRITDLLGRELFAERRPHGADHASPGAMAAIVAALVTEALDMISGGWHTITATVAVPGWTHDGRVISPTLDWRDAPMLDLLRASFDRRVDLVTVANDGNLGALAEYQSLRLEGIRNLIYLEGGAGVGGGVIVDGRQAFGAVGGAGEFGHVVIDPQGPECFCGQRGCLERYTALPVLLEQAGLSGRGMQSGLDELVRQAEAGDSLVLGALSQVAERLAGLASTASMIINPEVALLGGYFARVAPWLIPAMTSRVATARLPFAIRAGSLRMEAPLHGATLAAARMILDDPFLVTRPS